MPAALLTETQWHGNPRPVTAYASSVYIEDVVSPYYLDGRNVPTYKHTVTPVPLSDLVPRATIDIAGPAQQVEFTLDGLWPELTSLTIYLTLTGTATGDYDEVLFSPGLDGPVQAAAGVADAINSHPELAAIAVGQTVYVSAMLPVTAITITTLTVGL